MFELETERFGKVRVVFQHIQPNTPLEKSSSCGTVCFIKQGNSTKVAGGRSYLVPPDQYNKSRGRKIAFTRALEGLGATREERTQFWQAYWDAIKISRIKARNSRIDKKIDKTISELGYDL
jgi:hypothetical protein